MRFDFDLAYGAFKANPEVQKWMNLNKDQLIALTEAKIIEIVAVYVNGGDVTPAIEAALSLDQQAENMVTGSAGTAQRQYEAGRRLIALGSLGLDLFILVLKAGVLL